MSLELRLFGFGACTLAAAILAWRRVDGWGWFLFIAFIAITANPS